MFIVSPRNSKKFLKKQSDRKKCIWLERAFKGEGLYVFDFSVVFDLHYKKKNKVGVFFSFSIL